MNTKKALDCLAYAVIGVFAIGFVGVLVWAISTVEHPIISGVTICGTLVLFWALVRASDARSG